MNTSTQKRRKSDRPESLNGVSETRIKLLQSNISMRDVCERIKRDYQFNIAPSTISILLDEKLNKFVHNKIDEMCSEKGIQ